MEETTNGEEVTLNSEGQEDGTGTEDTQGEENQKTTYTQSEVDEMMKKKQSDTDRGVQKVLSEKTFHEDMVNAIKEISDDKKHLLELNESKPKVAQAILDKFYNGQTIEEYITDQGLEEDITDPEVVNKRIKSEAQRLVNEERISDKKNDFIEKLKMSDEEKTQFETAFEERKQLKSFALNDIQKHLEKAYREVNEGFDAKKHQDTETIARAGSSGGGKGASGDSTPAVTATKKSVDDFFDKYL